MGEKSALFRAEALAYYAAGQPEGQLLRLASSWSGVAYWLLVMTCVGSLAFAAIAHLSLYARGPAVVRVEGRLDLTTVTDGTVTAIPVVAGQWVEAGQVLVQFDGVTESQELARLQQEFDLLLVRTLRDLQDQAARGALSTLRAQKEHAEARLLARRLLAPRAGRIEDVRIRIGQRLNAGDLALTLGGQDKLSVVALLPGHALPSLHVGQRLRLELEGFRYSFQDVVLTSVGSEVIGPEAARRALRREVADSLQVSGPVVLVEATLPSPDFVSDGKQYNYYPGMRASAEVRTRSERIMLSLIPGLREVVRHVRR